RPVGHDRDLLSRPAHQPEAAGGVDRGRAGARGHASGGGGVSEPARTAAAGVPSGSRLAATVSGRLEWLPLAIVTGLSAVAIVVAIAVTPSFLTVDNIRAILRNASIVGIVAVGMTPVTLSGNFVSLGLSQSAMLAMVAFVALLGAGWSQVPAMLAVTAALGARGVLPGAVVAARRNPA